MNCAFCNRPMLAAAVFVGAMPIGPTCARKAGLIEPKRRIPRLFDAASRVQRDTRTLDLFGGAMARQPDPETLDLFAEVGHV